MDGIDRKRMRVNPSGFSERLDQNTGIQPGLDSAQRQMPLERPFIMLEPALADCNQPGIQILLKSDQLRHISRYLQPHHPRTPKVRKNPKSADTKDQWNHPQRTFGHNGGNQIDIGGINIS